MDVTLPARGVRIGGVTVAPGQARAVAIALAARPARAGRVARAVPAWVVVGTKPGPRISVIAATRGTESGAAAAARAVASALDPATLVGSVVIVPVLRPGGRFAPRRKATAAWRFPGDAGGTARARDAFTLFSELVVGAGALLALGAPRGGRRATLAARGALADPRVRRLAAQSGALVTRAPAGAGDLVRAAGTAGVLALELSAAESPGDEARAVESLRAAVTAALRALGALPRDGLPDGVPSKSRPSRASASEPPTTVGPTVRVRAPAGGLVTAPVPAGAFVRAGAVLAEIAPTLPGRATRVTAPVDALVVEAPSRAAARKGTVLFVLAPLAPGARPRRAPAATGEPPPREATKLRAGWIEHVELPDLAITHLKAKLDTGARTSALHVARMRTVDTTAGPLRRPILEITVPGGGRGRKPHRVRAAVRGYVVVRDTSGRTERRPVIETALHLGPLRKRIAVTLTNRGDMLYPMLIGRTALGASVVVDPAGRFLLKN